MNAKPFCNTCFLKVVTGNCSGQKKPCERYVPESETPKQLYICRVANMGKCNITQKECPHCVAHPVNHGCEHKCDKSKHALCIPYEEIEMRL